MADLKTPVRATDVPLRARASNYPEHLARAFAGRHKRALGEAFGLSNFGVNLTTLEPGAASSLRHAHSEQDEFVYVLHGEPTLHSEHGTTKLAPGMCVGFPYGTGEAHRLVNETQDEVQLLEVGDRSPDTIFYPDDDVEARYDEGQWLFRRKDGSAL